MFSLALTALAAAAAAPAPAPQQQSTPSGHYADLILRQKVVIRVPTREMKTPQITHWREKKGPRCIPGRGIAGAGLIAPDTVDFVLVGGQRVRAKLERSCPALDFYNGFYLRPDEGDGRVCAGRDVIHARSGGECQIRRFRRLVPDKREE